MRSKSRQGNRLEGPLRLQQLQLASNIDASSLRYQQILSAAASLTDFNRGGDVQVATSRNELMYRPTNSFNIHESLRKYTYRVNDSRENNIQSRNRSNSRPVDESSLSSVDSTISASRSTYSRGMEQNSLFHDNQSIEEYIAEITKGECNDGSYDSLDRPPVEKEIFPPQTMLSTEEAMHYSIKCNNLARWSIDSLSPRVKAVNFKIIQTIVYRESIILRLHEVLNLLDKCYWKYCVDRIRESPSIQTENLVLRRNQIFSLQQEVSVGIAHMRSLTIKVTEQVQKLRILIDRDLQMEVSISIYWKEINYMLKMNEDSHFIFDYACCRYWLGFAPNGMMIPPKDHNPFELWKRHSSELLKTFLASRKEKHQVQHHNKVPKGRKGSVALDHNKRGESFIAQMNTTPVSPIMTNPNESKNVEPVLSQRQLTEWEQLKDYCSFSWTQCQTSRWPIVVDEDYCSEFDDINSIWVQNAVTNPAFWNNSEHNPLIVEAAIGFPEVFPTIFLVPPLPQDLLVTSLRVQEILISEHNQTLELEELHHSSGIQKEFYAAKHSSDVLCDELSNESLRTLKLVEQCNKLKHRQQGDNNSLQGLSVDHLSSSYSFLQHRLEKSQHSSVCQETLSVSANSADGPFHLTMVNEEIADDNTGNQSVSSYHSIEMIDLTAFKPFRLENCSSDYKRSLEEKICDSRRIVERVAGDGIPKIRHDRKGFRELSRLNDKWVYMHAVMMQKVCRGFLARARVLAIKANIRWKRAILRVQACLRGFVVRRKYRRMQRSHKIGIFLLRKSAIKRFRAAVIITSFIRRVCYEKRNPEASQRVRLNKSVSENQSVGIPRKALLASEDFDLRGKSPMEQITIDQSFSVTDISFDVAEKQQFERMQALELIKRVNEGKVQKDSRRNSRLIPSKELTTNTAKALVKQFSKKQHSFFQNVESKSTISSTKDAFVAPIPRPTIKQDSSSLGSCDDSTSVSRSIRSLPPILGSESSRTTTSQSKLSFEDHKSLQEIKRRQKEVKEAEHIKSIVHKFFSE